MLVFFTSQCYIVDNNRHIIFPLFDNLTFLHSIIRKSHHIVIENQKTPEKKLYHVGIHSYYGTNGTTIYNLDTKWLSLNSQNTCIFNKHMDVL